MQSACAMIHQRGPKSLQPITVMVSKNACIPVKPFGRDCQQHFDSERVIACVSNPFALNFQRVEFMAFLTHFVRASCSEHFWFVESSKGFGARGSRCCKQIRWPTNGCTQAC